ncbi:MAG: tautomerase family protein [Candidatus Thiodiazotropha sp.]
MPYAELKITPMPTPEQAASLARGITDALVEEVGKRRAVTAVHITSGEARLWTIGSAVSVKATAYLDIKITQGSNSQHQKASLIARLHRLLVDTVGELEEASYIVIDELPAQNWGYAGLTQATRAQQGAHA